MQSYTDRLVAVHCCPPLLRFFVGSVEYPPGSIQRKHKQATTSTDSTPEVDFSLWEEQSAAEMHIHS